MKLINVKKKGGESFTINAGNLIGVSTKSLYIRKGFLSGTLFLSQRGNGAGGDGDICELLNTKTISVSDNLYSRLKEYAKKAKALV